MSKIVENVVQKTASSIKCEGNLPTFLIEVESGEVAPDRIRVKLAGAPDGEGESKTYWPLNPLNGSYTSDVELGQALFHSLFGKDESNEIGWRFKHYYLTCAAKPAGEVCLRILLNFSSIKSRAEPVVSLPWELLHDGQHWLAKDLRISIARRTVTREVHREGTDASLRVLLAYAEPQVLPAFAGEAYVNAIAEALQEISWLHLVQLPHANRTTFKEQIKKGFHVIHFLGHGEAKLSPETGLDACLHLESLEIPDKSDRLYAREFSAWFTEAKIKPQLVVLTACQSGIVDRYAVLGTAQALLSTGISAVVAMQAMLRLKEARWFAPPFYRQLASHANVDNALQAGRMALDNLQARSLQSGTEESLLRLLQPQLSQRPKEDDMGQIIDPASLQNEKVKQPSAQTIRFPAWAVPILLLNGDSRLGQEAPPALICWKLKEYDIAIQMVFIPEGNFYIDKFPVIYADFKKFATDWTKPDWSEEGSAADYTNYPATQMTVQEAQAFAAWTGRHLPAISEWQQAALSGISDKNQSYPWGYEFRPLCNTRETGRLKPISVASEAAQYESNINPSGMCGIMGNVAEFVLDNGKIRVCGGSYLDKGETISIQYRPEAPSKPTSQIGFRCIAAWSEIKQAQETGKLSFPLSKSMEGCER